MQEPARLCYFAAIETFAEKPDARAGAAFDAEIIAGEGVARVVAPPFHGDTFRTFGHEHLMPDPPPAEPHRRPIRHFGDGLDRLWPPEDADGTRGGQAILRMAFFFFFRP